MEDKADNSTLLKEAIDLKEKGNTEFKKGKLFIKHTAGKNSLTEACTCYAKVSSTMY